MNDSEIIKSVLNGNRNDFRLLVDRYGQAVFRIATGYVHEKEEAEDLTQEIFISAWQSLAKFRGDATFSTWLHRIAVNACLNHTRKNTNIIISRLSSFFGAEDSLRPELPAIEESAEEIIIRKEHLEWIGKALDSIPANQHTAIVLSKYEDLSQKEIAEIMNISEGAVEALLQRAKKNLREKLMSASKKMKKESRKN